MYNQAPLLESVLFAVGIFGPVFLAATFLTNYLLPIAIKESRKGMFILWFIGLTLFTSCILACVSKGFYFLEEKGIFESSVLLRSTDSFFFEFVKSIPSVVFTFLGFFGVRFYYEHSKLEKANRESQFQSLQAQITPHFMFNVLNHIDILMQENVELASSLLIKYSDILRYQLYNGQKEYILLGQEIEFLKNYVAVEEVRWEGKLDINCQWIFDNEQQKIAPLLLITFIENAFKHVSRTDSEKGYINIDFRQKENSICLEVKNSKSLIKIKENENSGIGLKNTKKRLDILYSKKHELQIEETVSDYYSRLTIQS